jgi:hypothetical protein
VRDVVVGAAATVGDTMTLGNISLPAPVRTVKLVEESIFTILDSARDHNPHWWIFDTSTSNHMTGTHEAFNDLDAGVAGTVRFSDGSIVRIEGYITILFTSKNGEHRTLDNVYFISRLTANIISYGLLDEVGYEIHVQLWDVG